MNLVERGVDGIVLSNHGGRQLDRAPITFHLLPAVVREVGDAVEISVDTGIMSGADSMASIALGANFTMIGHAYLYGLMAGEQESTAPSPSTPTRSRTMKPLGVSSLEELTPGYVTQLKRLVPRQPPGVPE